MALREPRWEGSVRGGPAARQVAVRALGKGRWPGHQHSV